MKKINRKITKINFYNSNRSKSQIKYLVYHYVGAVSSAKNNADYFYNTFRGASAHYFVDENEIWQVVEDNDASWAVGDDSYVHRECRNSNSISIEMCCKKKNGKWYIEEETIKNAIELGQYLIGKYGFDRKHVLRHYDVTGKICPEPMVRDESKWTNLLDRLFGKTTSSNTNKTESISDVKDYTIKVTTDVLNVRKKAGTNNKIISEVTKGQTYTITKETKVNGVSWGKLKEKEGWICLDYTEKVTIKKPTTSSVYKKMKVNTKEGLNVRSTPGGTKVGALVNGTEVTVIEEQGEWSKIGDKKWVCNRYLKAVSTTSSTSNSTISVKVGSKVKLKTSAEKYVTGETIPNWVKNKTYTVLQVAKNKILLKEIMSWVYLKDLTK